MNYSDLNIKSCAFDIFRLLVGRFDEVRALPQPAFRVLPGISVSFQLNPYIPKTIHNPSRGALLAESGLAV
jgi:hypothetical protein